jgi:hypothetical protein
MSLVLFDNPTSPLKKKTLLFVLLAVKQEQGNHGKFMKMMNFHWWTQRRLEKITRVTHRIHHLWY